MTGISVLVLTKNEEQDLPGCLESLRWSDDVVVLDSHSSDRTGDIAHAYGVRFVQRAFDGYASQRNAGLALPFKYGWVFVLDADERATAELVQEMRSVVDRASPGVAAFRMRRRDFLYGRWLKHVQASPWYVRLFRVGSARYEREVNEIVRADGEILNLEGYFDHFPFSKGLDHWLSKHNVYSSMEAEEVRKSRMGGARLSIARAFFERDFNERRYHQKELFYRLPARPLIKFVILYVLKRGFLDGRAGYTYARLQMLYESMIVIKTLDHQSRRSGVGVDES